MASQTQELEAAFSAWRDGLNQGDLNGFYRWIHDDAVIYDEDIPFRLSKADFINHIAFHTRDLWEFFEWTPREVRFQVWGDGGGTGVVSGYAVFRGKPKDAGFRQRFMGFSQTWVRIADTWRLVCWHQGPLHGQILGASPS
jgi:ketosteroid isomerase-like protein